MTTITFYADAAGRTRAIEADGHTNYARVGDEDIVCAGISTAMQMAAQLFRLIHVLRAAKRKAPERGGYLRIELEAWAKRTDVPIIVKGLRDTLEAMECRVNGPTPDRQQYMRVDDALWDGERWER